MELNISLLGALRAAFPVPDSCPWPGAPPLDSADTQHRCHGRKLEWTALAMIMVYFSASVFSVSFTVLTAAQITVSGVTSWPCISQNSGASPAG